jgi:quercetin dioxygenase-like cupin family protein
VLEGDLTLEVDGESHAAAAGESVIFSADADHSYVNNGTRPLHVIMIVITPPAAKTITPGSDARSGGAR